MLTFDEDRKLIKHFIYIYLIYSKIGLFTFNGFNIYT